LPTFAGIGGRRCPEGVAIWGVVSALVCLLIFCFGSELKLIVSSAHMAYAQYWQGQRIEDFRG